MSATEAPRDSEKVALRERIILEQRSHYPTPDGRRDGDQFTVWCHCGEAFSARSFVLAGQALEAHCADAVMAAIGRSAEPSKPGIPVCPERAPEAP